MNKEQVDPFQICRKYLDRPRIVYKISKNWKEKILETLTLIDQTILKIDNNENIDDFEFRSIEEILNLLTNLTFNTIADDKLKEFIHAYVFLAHNINENTFKYPGVTRKIEYLQRFAKDCLTYAETQNQLRRISASFSNVKGKTPSFRLSKHYYDLLKEE